MHRGSLLTRFFHKGVWKLTSPQSYTAPRQLPPLDPCTAPPAEGVLGVLGSSPCASCTSRVCEMLVLNLCVRISGFSKAGIGQCYVKMMCRSSSILPRSSKKDRVKPVLLLFHLPCVSTLSWYFVAALGKKKRRAPSRKDWQNGSMNYEFPVPESPFKFWLHTLQPCTSASIMQDICWQNLQEEAHGGACAGFGLSHQWWLQTRCVTC